MISIYQHLLVEGIIFPFLFPLPCYESLVHIYCMVVKSGRTPFEFEAELLLALPLLLTLAKFEEEATYKDYPLNYFFMFFRNLLSDCLSAFIILNSC